MKSLHLESGGFPLTTKSLEQLRDMTEQLAHVVGQMAGSDKVIVSGVEIISDDVLSPGWILIDGELLPFIGGSENAYITIVENVEQVQYLKDEDNNGIGDFVDAYIERYATFTDVATDNYLFDDFIRYDAISDVIKSGFILVYTLSSNSFAIGTGDFTNVEKLPSVGLTNDVRYLVEFEQTNYLYDCIAVIQAISISANGPKLISAPFIYGIYNKLPSSFEIVLKGVTVDITNSTQPLAFQISLIKK